MSKGIFLTCKKCGSVRQFESPFISDGVRFFINEDGSTSYICDTCYKKAMVKFMGICDDFLSEKTLLID